LLGNAVRAEHTQHTAALPLMETLTAWRPDCVNLLYSCWYRGALLLMVDVDRSQITGRGCGLAVAACH
jgi:hypothetical protein